MADNSRVQALLDEICDSGRTPEEVCGDSPELLPELRRRWARLCALRAELDALFPMTGPDPGPGAESAVPWQAGAELPQIAGYEVEAFLGRGGMGVVYKARHLRLNRFVALKMLLTGGFAGPDERARFQREAEAVAGLRHPNVVQVYDVGDHQGLPYFTMELLEAGSLAQSLAGTPQPARQAAALVATLAGAMQVAHRGGIVHRDLKPGNILLAADGTPRVADFGLARQFDGEPAVTLSGVRVGTPSYMAPEQFIGKAGTVGPAADIYALGAVLYELLTGRPPFRGETPSETERQVLHDEPVSPARLNPKVPRDLETICLKCLSKEPGRRYASAAALADDLTRFSEGRPIQARPLGWGGRLSRWGRREPTTAGLLAALSALFILTVGGGLWLERQQAERKGRAREAVETALAQLPDLRQQGRWPEAQAVLTQARSRLAEASSGDLERRLAQAEADLRLAAALEQIRLSPAIEGSRFDYPGMAKAYTQAFEHAGLDVWGDEKAVVGRIRESDLRPHLVTALDHWAYIADALQDGRSRARLLGLAQRVDPDPRWGDRFRSPELWKNPDRQRRLAEEAQQQLDEGAPASGPPTPLLALLAKKLGQHDGQGDSLLRAAQGRRPEDFWLNYALGEALRERKPAEAVGFYRVALAMRPTVAAVHFEVSMALSRQGQVDEAMRSARKSIELDPSAAPAHHQLGACWQAKGQLDKAMAEFRRAIQLDPKAAWAHHNIGMCLQAKGQLDQAMDEYRRAIELEPSAAPAHHQLGACWHAKGQFAEAMAEYRRALQLDPKLAVAHFELGACWQARGQLDEAVAEFRRAIELEPNGAPAHYQLGTCWHAKGQFDEAVAEYRRAVELDTGGGWGHASLAQALLRSGRFAEARTAARRGLDVLPAEEPRRPALHAKLELCERMLALDARLPALLQRKERPTLEELVELARLCKDFGRPHAAAFLYAAAFAGRPASADDLKTGDRFYAACAAARAAADEGTDAARLGDAERAGLRRQALDWLRGELVLRTRLGRSIGPVAAIWQTDTALSSVRDRAALARLPAEEREDWQRLWADVDASLAADPIVQGRACAARRDWAGAPDWYTRAIKRRPTDDGHFWFEYAALFLLSGDSPGYGRACAHMIERCGKDGGPRPYHVARACTLAPAAVTDSALPGRLAEKELQHFARAFWSLTEQGALAYRAGRFQQAVPLFEQSLKAEQKPGRAVLNWLWLALTNQRLGKAEEARRWLDEAQAWLDQYDDGMPARAEEESGLHLHNWLEAHVLRREAEALIPSTLSRPGAQDERVRRMARRAEPEGFAEEPDRPGDRAHAGPAEGPPGAHP